MNYRAMYKKPRKGPVGICPYCNKTIGLYANGTLRRHGLGWAYGGGCDGSFRKPFAAREGGQ